jgi:hypothetical protein
MIDTPLYWETVDSTGVQPNPDGMDPELRAQAVSAGKAMVVHGLFRSFLDKVDREPPRQVPCIEVEIGPDRILQLPAGSTLEFKYDDAERLQGNGPVWEGPKEADVVIDVCMVTDPHPPHMACLGVKETKPKRKRGTARRLDKPAPKELEK